MKEYLIIDGYNVINGWSELKRLAEESLEEARIELVERMAEYQSCKGVHVVIVFDAHMVKGTMEKTETVKGIKVVFTKERETADSYIEKFIVQLSKRHRAAVVTNDWAEQQVVLGGGATRISVRELIIDYSAIKNNIQRKTEILQQQKDSLSNRIDPLVLEKLEKFRRRS
ncbi:NYN domain-containing protein [Clostridium formicaceticum]|uniref:YacP-like NYN domain protein n=1 Tax=Clostridium formicaceticum TaxID=1497 RepID=A0AAC9RP35_9CLOT|nr:NYN domain-containing protein [Clostridium formicaceticum]AOY75122.1 hypothetical protein BJL90_03910 [Clostridium formicaceticum]ARE89546.1 YacP-like NYN domain protein [Clostridium formicaceticum]